MTKVIRTALVYILVLIMCLGCVSIGSFAVLGEAFGMTAAAMGAMGYAGVGAVTDIAIGDLGNMSSDMGIPIGQSNYKYNQSSGSVTYDTSVLNAILDKLALDFNGATSFRPSPLNPTGAFEFAPWATSTVNRLRISAYSDGVPSSFEVLATSSAYNTSDTIWTRRIPKSEFSGKPTWVRIGNMPSTTTALYDKAVFKVLTVRYYSSSGSELANSQLQGGASSFIATPTDYQWNNCEYVRFSCSIDITNGSAIHVGDVYSSYGSSVFSNIECSTLDFQGTAEETKMFELNVPSGHNWQDYLIPEDETVPTSTAVTFYNRDGENILIGLPPAQASQRLQEAFLNNEIAGTEISLGDGTVAAPDDDGDGLLGLIGAEVAWIRRLIQQLLSQFPIWLNGVKEAVVEAIESIKSHFNPDTFNPPLGFIPSGGFGFAGIWHYVVEWVSSLGAGLGFFASVWAGLPYAMVVPIYASAVVVIVVALFKRYIH